MPALRRLVLTHRYMAAFICLLALALKIAVPTGFMFASHHGKITVKICSGLGGETMTIDLPMTSDERPGHGKPMDHGKEMPCAYSGLSMQALGGVDPILVLVAIAFIMALALSSRPRRVEGRTPYLRPPLRGPPAYR